MANEKTKQASDQTEHKFGNVRQASDVDSISSILGAALFGITNINNLESLAKASNNSKKGSLANTLAIIGNTFDKEFVTTIKQGIKSTVKYLKFINENINKNIDKKFTKLYNYNKIDFDAFVGAMSNINDTLDSLNTVLEPIKNILNNQPKAPTVGNSDNANIVSTQQTLNIVVTGVNNESLDLVKQLANVKLDEKSLLSAESIDKLIEVYKKIDELFKLQVTIEANAKASSNASQAIQDTLDKVAESAVTAKQKQKDIEDTAASLGAIMNFITGATFVLVIGAAVMMIPGMVEASLKFAGVLTVFIAAILTPILLLNVVQKALGNKFVKDKKGNDIPKNIDLLNGFVAACGFTMMIGALFMLIPGMVENSLKFAVVLTLFIAGVSLAIRLLPKDKAIMDNLKQFSSLITVCSFIMIFGALVMMLGGGKFIKNALLFGVTLGLFIFLVLGPIMLFSKLFGPATLQLTEFNKVIIVAAVTMLIGAAVMMLGGGKYVKYALQFGAVLGLFIAMVIAPTLLLNIFGKTSTDAIKRLTTLIIVSTIVLMLGAYFMTTKYPIYALAFTGLLSLFITAIILPLLALYILSKPALSAIKHLTVLILVSTICLLIGSYFMQDEKRAWSALAFTGLMLGFMVAIVGPLIVFKSKIAQAIPIAYSLALLVVACTASLVIGAWAVREFDWNIVGFGVLLAGFIWGILKVYDYVLSKSKTIKAAVPLMKEISLSLLALTGVIGIATAIGKIFGWGNVAIAIGMLTLVSIGFAFLYKKLDLAKRSITGGAIVMLEIAGSIGILVAALAITTWLVDTYNAKTIVGGVATLAGVAVIFWGLYALLSHASKDVTTGAVVMLEIAASVAIFAGVLTLTTWLVDTYDAATIWGGLGVLVGAAAIFGALYLGLTKISGTVSTGAIVLLAIAASVAVLAGVLALTTWLFDTYGWEGIGGGLTALAGTAAIFGLLYWGLASIGPGVAIGSVVLLSIAASVGVLTLVVWGLCALIEKYTKEKIENAPKVLVSFVIGLGSLFEEIIWLSGQAILTTVALPFILPPVLGIATILTAIGRSVKIYKSAGKIDIEGIKKTIKDFFTITDAMPNLPDAVILSTKLSSLQGLVEQINEIVYVLSDSVSNVANLKIATAWNSNGIATDYKYLTTEDFTIAATNIGLIFTTLAGAIKDTYDNNGQLFTGDFDNILKKIESLTKTEGYILSTLSDNLQSYANLLIPRKWNKNGEPIAFRTMTEEDFTNAGVGIAKVLTTMAAAIWKTYNSEESKQLFGDDFEDILENIKILSVAEGEILSTLSEGLQAYTQLLIPTKWNNKGKAIGFRQMRDTDFIKAGENIGAVMVTTAGAIKSAWTGTDFTVNGITIKGQGGGLKELHSGGWFGIGTGVGDIIKELQPMGDLISGIAQGLCAYAQLLIPIDWNSKGRPTKFEKMDNTDIQLAGNNIGLVLTGLTTAVKDAYDSMDTTFGDSVEEILSALMPMGELISNIAEGMSDYAELKFPEYDANGKIKGYKQFKDKDFTDAERNIGKVITGLAGSLKKAYEELPNDSADTIKNIIEAFVPIGDLISNISEGIIAYANAKIPTGFGKDGKPLGYAKIDDTLIGNCSKNIKAVLFATLFGDPEAKSASDATGGIIGAYNILEKLNMHKKIDNILKSMLPVGEFISSMTDSISSFSKMQFPNAWDENGKPTSFLQISDDVIVKASKNITKVIIATLFGNEDLSKITDKNSVSGGVIGAYNALQKMKLADDIQEILESMMPVGELIGNMANGVSKFATLQIPIKWDPKTGNAIDYMKLSDNDFTTAGENIKTVITTIFKAIPEIYKGNEYLFDTEDPNAPIVIVMDSISKLGSAIKDIAEGVQTFANGGIPKFNNEGKIIGYTMFNETTGQKAASTIGKIMTALSKAVVDVYNTNLKGKITTGDFAEAIAAIGGIGSAVKNIAEGVQAYAELKMPTGWDKDGKPLGYKKLPKDFITKSKKNITSIIMSLSESLSDAWKGNKTKNITGVKDLFEGNTLQSIITTVTDVNSVISIVGTMVAAISDMKVAQGFNAEGKPTGFNKLEDSDLTNLYKKITDLLVALPKSVYDAYNNNNNKIYFDNTEYISKILKPLPTLGTLVKQIKDIVNIIGEAKISEIFKTNKRKAKTSEGKDIEFQVGAFKDIYIVTDEISTIIQKLIGIPAIDQQLDTIDNSFSVLSSRINELSEAINNYYENKAFEENINRVSRFVSETVNTLDIEKIDHLLALIESMNRLSDKTTTLDSLTNAIANNLSVVLKQLADKMEEAKATIKITEQMQAKRHKLINDSIATVKNIMSKEIIVTVNTATNDTTSSTDTGSYSPGVTPGSSNSGGLFGGSQMPNIGAGTGADISTFPSANTIDNTQQPNGKANQIGKGSSHINTQTSTINDMSEKINTIYNIIKERF